MCTNGQICTEAQTSASILYDASGQQILPTSRRRTELDNAVLQASGLRVIQHPLGTPDGPGGRYRLCWRKVVGGMSADPSVEIGFFQLRGPLKQQTECTLGILCVAHLAGHGMVVSSAAKIFTGTACGITTNAVSFGTLQVEAQASNYTDATRNDSFVFGTELHGPVGSSFTLCWDGLQDASSSFAYVVGSFRMVGPLFPQGSTSDTALNQRGIDCWLGLRCIVQLSGEGIAYGSGLCLSIPGPPTLLQEVLGAEVGNFWVYDFGTGRVNNDTGTYNLSWGGAVVAGDRQTYQLPLGRGERPRNVSKIGKN